MLRRITTTSLWAIALSVALFLVCIVQPLDVLAAEVIAPRYILVPVYYLTDRNKVGDTYGSERKYFANCKHDMWYGTAYIPVENLESIVLDDETAKLGWLPCPERRPKISHKDEISGVSAAMAKKKFFDLIGDKLQSTGRNELLVFVHGADDGFEDALLDAAALSYYIRRPLIMYSWPSVPKMLKYIVDSDNSEWSQAHFNMFAKDIIALNKIHPLDLTIISHSMGNRLVVRSVSVMAGTHIIKDLELVSPDIDEETFKHYVMDLRHARGTVRLYVSYKDKMLPLSQLLHGGYYRLGEGVGSVLGRAIPQFGAGAKNSIGAPSPGASNTRGASAAASESESAESSLDHDLVAGEELAPGPPPKIEGIDFSILDSGFRGHTIPFKLISNMIHEDTPGPGYHMNPTANGRGSKLARIFAGRDAREQPGHAVGHWQKVVKDASIKGH